MAPEPADAPSVAALQPHSWKSHGAALHRGRVRPVDLGRRYTFSFVDADIVPVANEVLSTTLNQSFAIDPAVNGKMSFHVDRVMSRDQLLEAFEEALSLNDVVMVQRGGGGTVLMPRAKARTIAPLRHLSSERASPGPGFQLLSVPVAYAAPSDIGKALEGAGVSGLVVRADDQQGVIVLAGTSAELRNALETVRLFDRSGLVLGRTRTIALHAASASAVSEELTSLLKATGTTGVTVTPIQRLGQIVITARSSAALDEAASWAGRLDLPSHEENYTLWLYHPLNVSAASLADTLNQLLSDGPQGDTRDQPSPSGPGAAAPDAAGPTFRPAADTSRPAETSGGHSALRVSVDKEANTLLIMAPQSRWAPVKAVLDQLDVPAAQVLIEASVLEVTLGNEFRTGVDWTILGAGGHLTVTSSQSATGSVTPEFPGLALTYFDNSVKAVVDALASKTNVEVVSAPKLIARDNQPATLQVGDQVPIVNQSAQSTSAPGAPLVATTEYRDTGIILKVKPRVNGADSVVLDFSQEVSSVSTTTTSTINSPTIQQRRFQTQMTLHDGQTVAVGGLISSSRSVGDHGVPWLKDAPLVGVLFKGADKTTTRTEIIVLLSAHIIHSREEAAHTLEHLRGDMPGLESHDLLPGR